MSNNTKRRKKNRRDRTTIETIAVPSIERWRKPVSTVAVIGWLAIAYLTDSFWQEGHPVGVMLFLLGSLCVSVSVIGRAWCLSHIAGHKTETLVIDGPYSLCRNPLYFFSLIGAVGMALGSCMVTLPVIVIVAFGIYYPLVIRSESIRLQEIHGEAFQCYRQSTPALIPWLGRFHERSEHSIDSRAFRRNLFDSVWFFVVFALLHSLHELHQSGQIPVLYHLP